MAVDPQGSKPLMDSMVKLRGWLKFPWEEVGFFVRKIPSWGKLPGLVNKQKAIEHSH